MSKQRDDLGHRMKEYYEQVPKTRLLRRTPVAVRIDGKAFHTFTKGFKKPFDEVLMSAMQDTMTYLCENVQGCVLGYTQSDEITLILCDYQTLSTSAWYDYEAQKVCSVSASMATMAFNKAFEKRVSAWEAARTRDEEGDRLSDVYARAVERGAMFDSRCFNIPREEVTNLVLWRQLDASKNSIQMLARAYFSHGELHGLGSAAMQDKLVLEAGVNWNDLPTECKRGSCAVRGQDGKWTLDREIPIFKGEGREYVEKRISFDE